MLLFYDENSKEKKVAVYTLVNSKTKKVLFECERELAKKITKLWEKCNGFVDDNEMFRTFLVSGVCREDLKERLTEKQIAQIDDGTMQYIADKMGDSLQEAYWISLETIIDDIIKPKLKEKV